MGHIYIYIIQIQLKKECQQLPTTPQILSLLLLNFHLGGGIIARRGRLPLSLRHTRVCWLYPYLQACSLGSLVILVAHLPMVLTPIFAAYLPILTSGQFVVAATRPKSQALAGSTQQPPA